MDSEKEKEKKDRDTETLYYVLIFIVFIELHIFLHFPFSILSSALSHDPHTPNLLRFCLFHLPM